VLVIADNASSEAQVGPLLPGAGLQKALMTSHTPWPGSVPGWSTSPPSTRTHPPNYSTRQSGAPRPCDGRITDDPESSAGWTGCRKATGRDRIHSYGGVAPSHAFEDWARPSATGHDRP